VSVTDPADVIDESRPTLRLSRSLRADLLRRGVVARKLRRPLRPRTAARTLDVLVDHLDREHPDEVRHAIAEALSEVPAAGIFWERFVAVYEADRNPSSWQGVKQSIANLLAAHANRANQDDLIRLILDRSNGDSRVYLFDAVARLGTVEAEEALRAISNSDDTLAEP
jgi:hypothetical protein